MPPSRGELPDTLTVSEVADMLNLSTGTIKNLVSDGELDYIGEIGDRSIDTDSLVRYVNRRFGK